MTFREKTKSVLVLEERNLLKLGNDLEGNQPKQMEIIGKNNF